MKKRGWRMSYMRLRRQPDFLGGLCLWPAFYRKAVQAPQVVPMARRKGRASI